MKLVNPQGLNTFLSLVLNLGLSLIRNESNYRMNATPFIHSYSSLIKSYII